MYSHPEDRRAQRRRYYRDHQDQIKAQANSWYQQNKNDPGYQERRAAYMRDYRWRRRHGL